MGTRLQPGRFDCHEAALDDEPRFTLLARDPLGAGLVRLWAILRAGDIDAAMIAFDALTETAAPYRARPDLDPASEAFTCALSMMRWRATNDGRWRSSPIEKPGDAPATPPGPPNSDAAAEAPAVASIARPIGPLCSGHSTTMEDGA